MRLQATEDDVYHLMDLKEQYFIMTAICSVAEGISAYFFIYQKRCWDLVYLCTVLALAIILLLRQAIKISRSVMAPMAFSRTERMKHFMEALSMGKGLKFSLRAFKKPLLTEEEYQLLSYLQREGDVSYHLKCLKEKAKSREPHLADSLQEQIQREFIIRQLALFMISLGKEAYIPSNFYKCEKRLVHILSDDEISAFFHEIDSYSPEIKAVSFLRLSTEYKVIFRLIYCCGLRISEARKLKWSDAGLGAGILTIMHSKGHKDRLVYMSDNLTVLIKEYKTVLNDYYGCISEWVFPAREQGRCLCSVTINAAFRRA